MGLFLFVVWSDLVRFLSQPCRGLRAARARLGLRFGRGVTTIVLALGAALAWAQSMTLTQLEVARASDGVFVNYAVDFELAPPVEEALLKGMPLHFVADASLFRSRWYWRDRLMAQDKRTWRLTYQPLTRRYRVNLDEVAQSYDSLREALDSMRRVVRWKLADPLPPGTDERYYLEFAFRLDPSQLPGPLQLGVEGQPDWVLHTERTVPLPEVFKQ